MSDAWSRPDIDTRLDALRGLQRGWLDGEGEPIPEAHLATVREALHRLTADAPIPSPYIYPTPDGGLQAEWDMPGLGSIGVEFAPSGAVEAGATTATSETGMAGRIDDPAFLAALGRWVAAEIARGDP